jgi:hypothetical protein
MNNIKLLVGVLATISFAFPFGVSALNCPEGEEPCEHNAQCGACQITDNDVTWLTSVCTDWWDEDGNATWEWSGDWTQAIEYSCGTRTWDEGTATASGSGSCSGY